jgi:hypothetical protein
MPEPFLAVKRFETHFLWLILKQNRREECQPLHFSFGLIRFRLMNFFRYLWFSCSGFRTYVPLFRLRLRSSLQNWAIFCLILSTGLMLIFVRWFNFGFPLIKNAAVQYLPSLAITNGHAYSSLPQPYITNTNDFPIILDLKGELKDPQKMFPEGIILKEKQLEFWRKDSEMIPFLWSNMPNGEVNGPYLDDLEKKGRLSIPFLFVVFWLIFILLGIVQALLFTIFAGFLERAMNPSFSFSQLFNISLFSIFPSSLISMMLMAIGFENVPIFYFACYCFFVVMASGACRLALLPPKQESHKDDEI